MRHASVRRISLDWIEAACYISSALNVETTHAEEAQVATRIELTKQYMEFQRDQKYDELLAALADDVTISSPMTGTISGKDAVSEQIKNMPIGRGGDSPMGNITWQDPEAEGDDVKVLGTGSPMGTLKIQLGFNDDDLINKVEMGLA